MEKVIRLTESDLARIVKRVISEGSQEDKLDMYLRRRVISIIDLIDKNIDEVEQEGILFNDEFEFAYNIISWVVQDMGVPDGIDEGEIIDFIKDEHGDYILSHFNSEDEEDDDDDNNWDDDDWDEEEEY